MRNSFKSGIVVLIVSIIFSACDPAKPGSAKSPIDSNKSAVDTPQKIVDTANKAATDSIKKDSVKK
jgi:hypothetical protein